MDKTVSASLGRRFVSSTLEAGGAPLTVATPAPASLAAAAGVPPVGGVALPAPESGVTASGPALFGGVGGAEGGVLGLVFEAVELEPPPPANIIQPPTANAI